MSEDKKVEENNLIQLYSLAEESLKLAKKKLTEAKNFYIQAETEFVNAKINLETISENLRVCQNAIPKSELSLDDQEVIAFRQKHSELCEWAKQRDIDKNKEK